MEIYPFVSPANMAEMSAKVASLVRKIRLIQSCAPFTMGAARDVLSRALSNLSKALLWTICIGLSSYAAWRSLRLAAGLLMKRYGRRVHTWLLAKSEVYALPCQGLRTTFINSPDAKDTAVPGHTHAVSAALRSAASTTIDNFAKLLGRVPYFVQMSSSDQKIGRKGSRTWFWSKDAHVEPRSDPTDGSEIRVYIDVDQYIDMNEELCNVFQPTVVYTFQPSRVARVAKDYSYTCLADGSFEYRVTGGGRYCHPVWNYAHDSLLVSKTFFGIRYSAAVYAIERRPFGEDHDIILLAPVRRWGLISFLTRWLDGPVLERINPVAGDFLRMRVMAKEGMLMSTGRVGEYNCATVAITIDESLATTVRTCKVGLTLPSVMSVVEDKAQAAILHEYHSSKVRVQEPIVYPVNMAIRTYQIIDPKLSKLDYEPEAKSSLLAFMSPIVSECFTPAQTKANEVAAIAGRVTDVKSTVEKVPPSYLKYMEELIWLQFPVPGILDPVDDDELYARQARPTQRRLLAVAGVEENDLRIKSFMKKEAYQDVKDPRIISTYHPSMKAAYSKYIYALADEVAKMKWYAFCKTPAKVAELVAETCKTAKVGVTPTDLSRCDGRISQPVRNYERRLLLHVFKKKYHEELIELNRDQYNLTGFGMFGTKYKQGTARGSGSAETAIMNSETNVLIAYTTKRISRPDLTPLQCYQQLGVYGGDDGLTPDVDEEVYQKVAAMFGQKLEATTLKRGQRGVNFLARIYTPDVWFGDVRSVCDIARQLSKLHATVALPSNVSPLEKLVEKLRGYMHSDATTPVIGDLIKAMVKLNGPLLANDRTQPMAGYYSSVAKADHFPNDNMTEFGMSVLHEQIPTFNYHGFKTWLDGVTVADALLSPPLCAQPSTVVNVSRTTVVDGTLIRPKDNGKPKPKASAPRPRDMKRGAQWAGKK